MLLLLLLVEFGYDFSIDWKRCVYVVMVWYSGVVLVVETTMWWWWWWRCYNALIIAILLKMHLTLR